MVGKEAGLLLVMETVSKVPFKTGTAPVRCGFISCTSVCCPVHYTMSMRGGVAWDGQCLPLRSDCRIAGAMQNVLRAGVGRAMQFYRRQYSVQEMTADLPNRLEEPESHPAHHLPVPAHSGLALESVVVTIRLL